MLSIVSVHGFESKSTEALTAYKADILSSGRVTEEEKLFLETNMEVLSFMISSSEVKNYYIKLSNAEIFTQSKAQVSLQCTLASITYGLNFILCLTSGINCGLLPAIALILIDECQDKPADLCANNPDPCCPFWPPPSPKEMV